MSILSERSKRVAKIEASAQPHLEDGEAVRELAQVQTGESAYTTGGRIGGVETIAQTTGVALLLTDKSVRSLAILTTDRNLYVLTLTGARLLTVGEVVLKVPIADAEVTLDKKRELLVHGATLHVMGLYRKRAERLVADVAERSSVPPPPQS